MSHRGLWQSSPKMLLLRCSTGFECELCVMAGRAAHALKRAAAAAPRIDRRTLFAPRKAANPEALSLYRDILRASRHFHWADKEGEPWCVGIEAPRRRSPPP